MPSPLPARPPPPSASHLLPQVERIKAEEAEILQRRYLAARAAEAGDEAVRSAAAAEARRLEREEEEERACEALEVARWRLRRPDGSAEAAAAELVRRRRREAPCCVRPHALTCVLSLRRL